ncbi:MAG: anaerobic ribonucleoside-triphosphate reductase activating protein [Victivallales bacterium]|jgi:pyruvate formate lyase activating enzyme|nr:anaerobic ribonucleoside-triphosphate reductase activating protein [Victivallales bacterium]
MDFRGLVKFTLVDYPGKIGCIVFSGGCNLRCPFCHNPCLVFDPGSQPKVTEKEFFNFLERRKGLLEGVVFSGGEPLLNASLPDIVSRVRSSGFCAKIDTNGTLPEKLSELLADSGADALGIDYKAPRERYCQLTGSSDPAIAEKVLKSLGIALSSGLALDIRTTVHRSLLDVAALGAMYEELKAAGVNSWTLQQYHPVEVIDDELSKKPTFSDAELVRIARRFGPAVRVRGLTGRIIENG